MSVNYLFIIISFFIGYFLVQFLRSYDLHEKEPMGKMLFVTFWGGIWSVVISLVFYALVHNFGIKSYTNVFGAMLIIAPVEELAKFLALLSSYPFIKKELNEPTDGLVYMACVSLGFSLIENYFYAVYTPNSGYLLFLRLLFSTPLHIFASLLMGLAFYQMAKLKKGVQLFFISYVYAILVHGIYDSIAFHSWLTVLLVFVLKFSYHWSLSILSYTTAKSPFRHTLSQAMDTRSQTAFEDGLECINCGNKEQKDTRRIGKIKIQKCHNCGNHISTVKSLFDIYRHFGSDFRNLIPYYRHKDLNDYDYSTLYQGNYVSDEKKVAFFSVDEMENALEKFNMKLVDDIEKKWWFYRGLTIA